MQRKLIIVMALLLASPLALATQTTGELVEMTDTRIVVKKGKKDLVIARDAGTKLASGVKVGDRVKVDYTMTATSIQPKAKSKSGSKTKDADKARSKAP